MWRRLPNPTRVPLKHPSRPARYFARFATAPKAVLQIKLADWLSNVQRLATHPRLDKQRRYYGETVHFFLPLAQHMPWFAQSIRTTRVGGSCGYNGGKNIKKRKRHSFVDTQSFVLTVKVHDAHSADRDGARLVLGGMTTHFPRVTKLWVDSGYNGRYRTWAADNMNLNIELVKHWWPGNRGRIVMPDLAPAPVPSGFHVLPRRWVVERTVCPRVPARPQSRVGQGLRTTAGHQRNIRVHRDDTAHGPRLARQQALQRE